MKSILFYSDVHYTDKKPSSRKDDYTKSIMNKLIQIDNLSRKHKVDMVLCGGDIVHKANESYKVFNDLYEYFSNTYVKHTLIAGFNHDFSGGNYESGLPNSILGSLKKTGCITEVGQTYEFNLLGVGFYSSHRTITPEPFFGGYTLYEELETDAKVVLCSHIHFPYGITHCNNKIFVAPGSVGRNASDSFNVNRRPQVALIIVYDSTYLTGQIDVELIPLDVELDVFHDKYLIKETEQPRSLEQMEQMIDFSDVMDAEGIIRKVGSTFSPGSVEEALRFKQKVENE